MSVKKILLVDDDKAFNFVNRMFIKTQELGCEVAEATDGRQAMEYISNTEDCPDVILLDINMPGVDGFGFLKEYEKRDKCCDAKVFMLTSSIRDEDREEALSHKMVKGYFDKPLRPSHIQEILDTVV